MLSCYMCMRVCLCCHAINTILTIDSISSRDICWHACSALRHCLRYSIINAHSNQLGVHGMIHSLVVWRHTKRAYFDKFYILPQDNTFKDSQQPCGDIREIILLLIAGKCTAVRRRPINTLWNYHVIKHAQPGEHHDNMAMPRDEVVIIVIPPHPFYLLLFS